MFPNIHEFKAVHTLPQIWRSSKITIDGALYDVEEHSVKVISSFDSSFNFIHIPDIHIGDLGAEKHFIKMIEQVNIEDPDFVIITGDFVRGGLIDFPWSPLKDHSYTGRNDEFKMVRACLLKFKVPVYICPGNHDYFGYDEKYDEMGILPQDPKAIMVQYLLAKKIEEAIEDDKPEDIDSIISDIKDFSGFYEIITIDPIDYILYYVDEFAKKFIEACNEVAENYWYKLDKYQEWLMPEFPESGKGYSEDYSFDYGNTHFIHASSRYATGSPAGIILNGLDEFQLKWVKDNYESAFDNGKEHSYIFTHGPVIRDYTLRDYSHDSPNDYDIIKWLDDESPNIEAFFVGHTHQIDFYFDAKTTSETRDDENLEWTRNKYHAYSVNVYWSYDKTTAFIETGKST